MIKRLKDKIFEFIRDDRFKEILFGSLYTTIAKILAMILGIVTSVIGARYYGADMVGFSMIVSSVLGIGAILSVFGLTTAMLQIVPQYVEKFSDFIAWKIYFKVLYLMIFISIIVSAVYYTLSDFIANFVFHNPQLSFFLSVSAFILVFRSVYDLNMAKIRLLGDLKNYALFQLLPKLFTFVLLLAMTYFFYNKYNLVYIVFSIPVLMTIVSYVYLARYRGINRLEPSSKIIQLPKNKAIISIAFPMMITNAMFLLLAQTDIIMLGAYRSTDEVGIYSIVLGLMLLINFVINTIELISGPKFSTLFAKKKLNELKYVARKSSQLTFWVSLPLILILALFGSWILSIYGEEFVYGYTPLLILLAGQAVSSMVGPAGYFLDMTGHQKAFRNIVLVAGGLNVAANYIFIPVYGIAGAATASFLSIIVWKIGASLYINKVFGFFIVYNPLKTDKQKGK